MSIKVEVVSPYWCVIEDYISRFLQGFNSRSFEIPRCELEGAAVVVCGMVVEISEKGGEVEELFR